MGYRVIFTPQSLDDLKAIVSFIAKDNSVRARTFGNELIDWALSVSIFPELGRIVPEINEPSVRETIHGPYRIIYEIIPILKQFTFCVSGMAPGGNRKLSL
jgi:toxin ParE1/3/4